MEHVADRLAGAIDRVGVPVCVGLDPVPEKLPPEVRGGHWEPARAVEAFCEGVVDAVAGLAAAVKPQSACFEHLGAVGMGVLERVCARARGRGLFVVLDAKRGDIGISAEHYAAWARHTGADAITVNGYLGMETVEPYLAVGLGVFVLVRTSNPGGDAFQGARLSDGRTIAELMGDHVHAFGEGRRGVRGLSDVGAVVGATKGGEGRALRGRMAHQCILIPGYGAQGGTPSDVALLARPGARAPGDLGVLVNASRSVIYAPARDGSWSAGVAHAARAMGEELRGVLRVR